MSCKKDQDIYLEKCPHCGKEIKIVTGGEHGCELDLLAVDLLNCDSCGTTINVLAGEGGKCIQCGKVGCNDEWCDVGWDPKIKLCNNCKYFYILENWFEPDERLLNKKFEIKSGNELLGIFKVERGIISIRPSDIIRFKEDEQLFRRFFIGDVLEKMEADDKDRIKNKSLKEDNGISYKIVKSVDGFVREIKIKHFRDYQRVLDLKNGISWTFEVLFNGKY